MTPVQRKTLDFIKAYIQTRDFSPSYDEIREALGLQSKSGVNRIVTELRRQGFIDFTPERARNIRVVDLDASFDVVAIRRAALREAADIAINFGPEGRRAAEAIERRALLPVQP